MRKKAILSASKNVCLAVTLNLFYLLLPQASSISQGKQAHSNPVSDNTISLRITLPNGRVVLVSEREGGMIRIEFNGQIYGLIPRIKDGQNNQVSIEPFEIRLLRKRGQFLGESIRSLGAYEIDQFNRSSLPPNTSSLPFNIQLLSLLRKTGDSARHVSFMPLQSWSDPTTDCCITCNGVKTCACAVEASCGSCCYDFCC